MTDLKPFEYTREWYETQYHRGLENRTAVDPLTFHPERDKLCLKDLQISRNHKILVCGCGGGDDTWLLNKTYGCENIYGIDWSQPAVDFCDWYFPWIIAQQGNVSQMPYDNNMFDRILALDITEHLPGFTYVCFLHEIRRVLRSGGRVAILPGMTRRPEHINLLPLGVIVEHLEILGFDIDTVKPEWVIASKENENEKMGNEN